MPGESEAGPSEDSQALVSIYVTTPLRLDAGLLRGALMHQALGGIVTTILESRNSQKPVKKIDTRSLDLLRGQKGGLLEVREDNVAVLSGSRKKPGKLLYRIPMAELNAWDVKRGVIFSRLTISWRHDRTDSNARFDLLGADLKRAEEGREIVAKQLNLPSQGSSGPAAQVSGVEVQEEPNGEVHCRDCGVQNKATSTFCGNCGHPLVGSREPTSSQ
jgi:hypothetical protein